MSSIDLDDLVATLNTHHIGSEAVDLANLQAQLQQALQTHAQGAHFPTSPIQTSSVHPGGAPVNTPTARTPSGPNWGQFADASYARRRRSSSAASSRARARQMIKEEDEDHWRHADPTRPEMDQQDVMEDVEEEAQVDASLDTATTSPLPCSHPSTSPSYGNSPTSFTTTDPFFVAQLQAMEQCDRQPSFFAQVATAQEHTSPFYATSRQTPQPSSTFFATTPSQPRQVPYPLTIDTGPRFAPVNAGRM